jgi:hypothetical protein
VPNFYCPLTLTLSRKRPCRNPVHGSRASPRTGFLRRKLNYLPVRPEHVEGLRLNCDTVSNGNENLSLTFAQMTECFVGLGLVAADFCNRIDHRTSPGNSLEA